MNFGAFLESIIYIVSASLLYPVLFLLVVLTGWVVIYSGSFFAEWLERIGLKKYPPERIPQIIRQCDNPGVFPHKVNSYIKDLRRLLNDGGQLTEAEIENFLQEKTLNIWKSLDLSRMVVRVGPSLGLMGTLIPMSTGLAALSQGDITQLSSAIVIAFTTTVVGLFEGIMAYFFYTIKRRWAEEDVKNIELATEMLTESIFGRKDR